MSAWLLHPILSWRGYRRQAYIGGIVEGLWQDAGEIRVRRGEGFSDDVASVLMQSALRCAMHRAMDRSVAQAFRESA